MKKTFLLITGISFMILSCSKGGDSTSGGGGGNGGGGGGGGTISCNNAAIGFTANVNPIIQTFCNQASCHNAGSINGPGPLTNHAQVFAARTLIRAAIISQTMPQNATLTAAQKNSIVCWIDSGAPNN